MTPEESWDISLVFHKICHTGRPQNCLDKTSKFFAILHVLVSLKDISTHATCLYLLLVTLKNQINADIGVDKWIGSKVRDCCVKASEEYGQEDHALKYVLSTFLAFSFDLWRDSPISVCVIFLSIAFLVHLLFGIMTAIPNRLWECVMDPSLQSNSHT